MAGHCGHSSFGNRNTEKDTTPEQELRAEPGSARATPRHTPPPRAWSPRLVFYNGSPSCSQSIFSCHLSAVSWRRA